MFEPTAEEIVNFIDDIIQRLPFYGEFNFEAYPPNEVVNTSFATGYKEVTEMVENLKNIQIRDNAIQQLIFLGFIINRHDIKSDGVSYPYKELTPKGRKLKELGSLSAYDSWENQERKKEEIREQETDELRRSNIITGKIQLSLLSINRWIAITTAIAAFCSLCLLVNEILKNFHWIGAIEFWTSAIVLFCGIILGLMVYLLISKLE